MPCNVSVSLRIQLIIQTSFCLPMSLSVRSNGPWIIGYPAPFKIIYSWQFLRTFCHSHQNFWNQFLASGKYAQNSLWQLTTGLTRVTMCPCFPPLFPWSGVPSEVPVVDHWFKESARVWDSAHHLFQWAEPGHFVSHADARRTKNPTYQPGQKVWLSIKDIRLLLLWSQVHCSLSHQRTSQPGHL